MASQMIESIVLKVSVDYGKTKQSMKNFNDSLSRTNKRLKNSRSLMNKWGDSTNRKMKDIGNSTKSLSNSFGSLGSSLAGGAIIYQLQGIISESIKLSREFKRVEILFKSAFGDQATSQMELARKTANKYGMDVLKTSRDMGRFGFAATQAGFSLEQSNEIFDSAATAMGALSLSADDQQGVLRALTQITTKANLQTEDLNQIAERGIPIFAQLEKALGKPEGSMKDLIATGDIMAKDTIPLLAKVWKQDFAEGALANANTEMARAQRVSNEFNEVMAKMGGYFAETKTMLLEQVIPAFKKFDQVVKDTSESLVDILTGGKVSEFYDDRMKEMEKRRPEGWLEDERRKVAEQRERDRLAGIKKQHDRVADAIRNVMSEQAKLRKLEDIRETLGLTEEQFKKDGFAKAMRNMIEKGVDLDIIKTEAKKKLSQLDFTIDSKVDVRKSFDPVEFRSKEAFEFLKAPKEELHLQKLANEYLKNIAESVANDDPTDPSNVVGGKM